MFDYTRIFLLFKLGLILNSSQSKSLNPYGLSKSYNNSKVNSFPVISFCGPIYKSNMINLNVISSNKKKTRFSNKN